MLHSKNLYFVVLIFLIRDSLSSEIRVTVNQGTLEGKVLQTVNGFKYRAFLGIPYAKPPIGDLRFKDPVPVERWRGILNATKEANICAQIEILYKQAFIGVEDCLYLNVYTPDSIERNQRLPVMLWIHGGAFINGNGNADLFGPDHLIERNIILVTINYRLGALGFLSLDTLEAPGNVGLKDQALALKWVNRNIQRFGGNARDVTIFGQSAGGASVNYLMLSPLTRGMFSKAIMESGTSLNEWALQSNGVNNTFKLGALLGIYTTDKNELIKSLVKIPIEQLVTASYSPALGPNPLLPAFVPVVEKNIRSASTFIDKDPRALMQSSRFNKIPIMIGYVSRDGYIGFHAMLNRLLESISSNLTANTLIPDFKAYVPFNIRGKLNEQALEFASQKIKEFYFPSENNTLDNLLNLMTDAIFVKDVDYTAKLFSRQTSTFYYRFSFKGSLNMFSIIYPLPYKEAAHGDELGYLFSPKFENLSSRPVPVVNDREKLTIRRMTEMWTNFAKYGNPTPNLTDAITAIWNPMTKNYVNCLSIDDELTVIKNPLGERMKFWETMESLYTKS